MGVSAAVERERVEQLARDAAQFIRERLVRRTALGEEVVPPRNEEEMVSFVMGAMERGAELAKPRVVGELSEAVLSRWDLLEIES